MDNKEHWTHEPAEHDYPAAENYLSLLMTQASAHALADRLRAAAVLHSKAKDLLRASGLLLLGADNVHVAKDLDKVREGQRLSPVLLVGGDLARDLPLTIADGYHRICASHHIDEDADIPCRMVDSPKP